MKQTAYQAKDGERMRQLGEAVKTTLIGGKSPDPNQLSSFMSRYAASGGRIENFSRAMVEWSKQANQSEANRLYQNFRSPLNRNIMTIMGGKRLEDFSTKPASTASASVNDSGSVQ
jgi:hypothetical protein